MFQNHNKTLYFHADHYDIQRKKAILIKFG